MAVFKMDKNFEIVLNPEAVKLVPELKSLSPDELRYVILVADYVDGPFRKKPLEERKAMARKTVYGDSKKNPETERLRYGMEAYRSLVFDIRRETVDIYKGKISKLQKETIAPDTTFGRMKEIDSTITFLQDRVTAIEHDLDIEEGDNVELKGQKKLSYLEEWQRRQREYAEYQKSI